MIPVPLNERKLTREGESKQVSEYLKVEVDDASVTGELLVPAVETTLHSSEGLMPVSEMTIAPVHATFWYMVVCPLQNICTVSTPSRGISPEVCISRTG